MFLRRGLAHRTCHSESAGMNCFALSPDTASQLPHFSSPDLVSKYAVVERLNYAYYLHHGRPSFAFGTFLVQELIKSKTPKQL